MVFESLFPKVITPMLVVGVPASMQKLPHLDLQLQEVVVAVQIEILLVFVLFQM